MQYTEDVIRRSLTQRLTTVYGRAAIVETLQNVASDLIGASDPADLPADCRAWVEVTINPTTLRTAS